MNIQEQNVPQSYRDLLATIPEKSNFFYEICTLTKNITYILNNFVYAKSSYLLK